MTRIRSNKVILITGATGAIGAALAREYAAPGISLILHGRNPARLGEVKSDCQAAGAKVTLASFDLRDTEALQHWVTRLCEQALPDLVIANAGMNTHISDDGTSEDWQQVAALLDLNIKATMALVNPMAQRMRARGRGQIALISSLAAYYGLPVMPSYSASKAALKSYGEGLRGWLSPEGVRVNVVMPGYVDSSMCREMPGSKPFVWPAERAARYIRRGLEKNRARISFPFPLNFGCWWLSVLPASISQRIVNLLGYSG